jgi:hypothetical protein
MSQLGGAKHSGAPAGTITLLNEYCRIISSYGEASRS